ncbi:HAMP domain-containing histidine kinase [Brevibacillus humidisoli]|uniref:sensor histidine kinase n=1 Tax=Brevibacillus humidisoli TaxID=2895522 RepID=UPI001E4A42E1|nr:HAMP domain-containing sensor histidine kinase [Brevibacillus humidisoli]UFJ39457.1 HAMP domain-containing histidine kinase [Brevibacillus humidisoli]
MRKLRVRTYFLFSLVLLLLLPWVFFVAAHLMTTQSLDIAAGRPNSHTVPLFAAFAGLLLAFFIIGMQTRRLLLLPLERMSQAARQIAAGDWDVQLPRATIREIAEVQDGFEIMVKGLQSSHEKQAMLEEERRFVIAAVAHDLRTPLFALRGYLDGLEQGIAHTPDQIAKYVTVCKEKSAQVARLVEELFTFAKIEYLEPERSESTADFLDIIQKSIHSLEPQAQQKHISIVFDHESDNCMIRVDSHVLERAMSNLLDNAVRYTPAHGIIHVRCRRERDRIAFTIHDSGPGFAPEDLQRIFEPLYRGEQSRNRATGGSGLGLTISRRIIRQHGGELAADNHPGGGAILSGCLPAANR